MHILRVDTDDPSRWLPRAEAVHRQLRPKIPADYAGFMRELFQGGGEMIVAVEGEQVLGLAVYRVVLTTFAGRRFYVDDLVTDEAWRSHGVGHALICWLEREARERGATAVELESGTQRTRAHRFYLREGFDLIAFSFRKPLDP